MRLDVTITPTSSTVELNGVDDFTSLSVVVGGDDQSATLSRALEPWGNSRTIMSGSTLLTWNKPSRPRSETRSGGRSSPRWWTTHAPTAGSIATTGCEHTVNHSDSAVSASEKFGEPVRSSFV